MLNSEQQSIVSFEVHKMMRLYITFRIDKTALEFVNSECIYVKRLPTSQYLCQLVRFRYL